jgi:hypothetical protein
MSFLRTKKISRKGVKKNSEGEKEKNKLSGFASFVPSREILTMSLPNNKNTFNPHYS